MGLLKLFNKHKNVRILPFLISFFYNNYQYWNAVISSIQNVPLIFKSADVNLASCVTDMPAGIEFGSVNETQ